MSVARDHVRRCRRPELGGCTTRERSARVPRVRGAQHLHGGGLLEEGQSSDGRRSSAAHIRRRVMATTATPLPGGQRPNVATAAVRFPAVRDYEQVDREIAGTLGPSLGWFAALGIAILCMLIGATTWTY